MNDRKRLPEDDLFVQALERGPPPEDSFYDLVATAIMICGGVSEDMVLWDAVCVGMIRDRVGGKGKEIEKVIGELVENGDVISGCDDIGEGYYVSEEKQEELRGIMRERKQQY